MSALTRKLMRDLRRIWAQGLAIALVLACGVAVIVLAHGSIATLSETRDAYYERNRFAEVFAGATRAPDRLAEEIARIDGVAQVQTRISARVVLDMEGMAEPGMAQLLSLPLIGEPALNIPLLRNGALPDPLRADEVAVSQPFAEAHGLGPGDRFRAIVGGQARDLRISGTMLSPEFIYTIGPGSIMPDDRRYGIIWMGAPAAAAAFDLDGAFNDVALRLTPGASEAPVIAALDDLLAPYGGTGAHGRDGQISHSMLQHELDQFAALAVIMPPVFFVVAAFLVNMVLGRLIAQERQQIGLMKAVGYSTRRVAAHYLLMSAGIGIAGVLIGWGAGALLAGGITGLLAEFFRFPYLVTQLPAAAFAISGTLAVATVVAGALRAVWGSVRLRPAVAMSPPAPPKFSRGAVDRFGAALRLRQTTMMILRSITRWPGRAAVTLFGVSASVAVLVASFFFFDAVDVMLDEMFNQSNRQHMTLRLGEPRTEAAVLDAAALPGVLRAEGAYSLPVRLSVGPRSELLRLEARSGNAELLRVLDRDGAPVAVPPEGLAMPARLARELDVAAGDTVSVELLVPPRETHELPVSTLTRQSLGEEIFMDSEALFRLMRTTPQVNRVNLMVDDAALPALYGALTATPAISGVMLTGETRDQFAEQIEENLFTMVFVYATLGILITVGVTYNAARIQLSERAHELASLRVLGFTRGEVGYVLVGELAFLTLIAVPVGWWLGYGFAALTAAGLSTEFVEIPLVVSRATYGWATLIVLAAAAASVWAVRRRLDRVDIVTALKQKE